MNSPRPGRFLVRLAVPIVLLAGCAPTTEPVPQAWTPPPDPAMQHAKDVAARVEEHAKKTEKSEGRENLVPDHVEVKKDAAGNPVVEQTGEASWYGRRHQGRKTAAGKRFNQHALTAAHPTLPLGTKAKVTNLQNGKSVAVTITDRGPYARGRDIDLSKGAAQHIGATKEGAAPVKIEAELTPAPGASPH